MPKDNKQIFQIGGKGLLTLLTDAAAVEKLVGKEAANGLIDQVDFDKELVLVAAGSGPNIIEVHNLKLSEKGDLQFEWSITDKAGYGVVARMLKISRAGIKTVNGKGVGADPTPKTGDRPLPSLDNLQRAVIAKIGDPFKEGMKVQWQGSSVLLKFDENTTIIYADRRPATVADLKPGR